MVECHIRFVGVYSLMRLINDQDVLFNVSDLAQLVKLAAKIDGTFHVVV